MDVLTRIADHFKNTYSESHYHRNDGAHQEDHFREVSSNGHSINTSLELGQNPAMIETVAWTHDLFAYRRDTHHLDSALWMYETKDTLIRELFTWEQRSMMARTGAGHHASYKGTYSSTFSELMATADRGFAPPREVLTRAYLYALEKTKCEEQALIRTVEHLIEKFGRGGYQKLPDMYVRYYGNLIEERYAFIERLPRLELEYIRKNLLL